MTGPDGVVVHLTTGDADGWRRAWRSVSNLLDAGSVPTSPDALAVVVHGRAVPFLLDPATAEVTADLREAGVSVRACANTLEGLGASPSDLPDGVEVVGSGVAEVVRLQREGWAYLKLPLEGMLGTGFEPVSSACFCNSCYINYFASKGRHDWPDYTNRAATASSHASDLIPSEVLPIGSVVDSPGVRHSSSMRSCSAFR